MLTSRELYEEELRRKQREHLSQVYRNTPFIPCAHDACTNCVGTGIGKDGRPCVHALSCNCTKCSPR
jgi:hypothetical protein